jgi:hypothetical protein
MKFARITAGLALCCLLHVATSAHAAPGPGLASFGDLLRNLDGSSTEIVKRAPEQPAGLAQLALACRHVGLLWSVVWTWNCRPVIATGANRYAEVGLGNTAPITSSDYVFSSEPSFDVWKWLWNEYGFWTTVAGSAVLFGLWKIVRLARKKA